MEQKEENPPRLLSAGFDEDSPGRTDDTSEAEEEQLNEGGNESLVKNEGGQTSIPEKQRTADETSSEATVQDELPRQDIRIPFSSYSVKYESRIPPDPANSSSSTSNPLGAAWIASSWNVDSSSKPTNEKSDGKGFLVRASAKYVPTKPMLHASFLQYRSALKRIKQSVSPVYVSGGDHSAGEEKLPPVAVGQHLTENPKCVDSHIQQPSPSWWSATRRFDQCYGVSSLGETVSAGDRTVQQAENSSDLSVKCLLDTDSIKEKRKPEGQSSRWKESCEYMSDQPPPDAQNMTTAPAATDPTCSEITAVDAQKATTAGHARHRLLRKSLPIRTKQSPKSRGNYRAQRETLPPFTLGHHSTENPLPVDFHLQRCLPRRSSSGYFSNSASLPSQITSPVDRTFEQVEDLSNTPLNNSAKDLPDNDDGDSLSSSYSCTFHPLEGEENKNEWLSGGDDSQMQVEAAVTAVSSSVTNTEPLLQTSSDPGCSQRVSSCLSRSHSVPSLSPSTSAENKTSTRSESLPDMLLKSSFEEFTPEVTVEEDDETYWFQCSCPGLYQCSVTGLVFHMEGEGDVVYRVVPWDRRLLAQHHKRPAGPLFDIKCLQQSVCRLHLPHCEISSTAGCHFLSVAHVKDDGIEFIAPHKTTETHVVINITGFSGFGNVKDEDSPPEPVRALVLLFYRPPSDPDLESVLNVLMLPSNVVVDKVLHTRKKRCGDEIYIETSSDCKLQPAQEYTLYTCPEDDSVLVQPTEAEFHSDNYDNYIPTFEVILEKILKHIKLFLRDKDKHSVWERRVCLSSARVKRSCVDGSSTEELKDVRKRFIDGISGPVLNSLLDKLLEKKVMTDPEKESAEEKQSRGEKARSVIDTVMRKGEAACSEMIQFLCEEDPFLSKHLGLIVT